MSNVLKSLTLLGVIMGLGNLLFAQDACRLSFDTIPSFEMGIEYQNRVMMDSALFYFERASYEYEELGDSLGYIVSLTKVVNCHVLLFNLGRAASSLQYSMVYVNNNFKSNKIIFSLIHYNKAVYEWFSNNIDSSFYYARKSLESRKNFDCPPELLAKNYYLLADLENRVGNYDEAIRFINLAIEGNESAAVVDSFSLAECYSDFAKYTFHSSENILSSIEYGRRALEIVKSRLGDKHPKLAYFYQNLGLYYIRKGDLEEGMSLYEKARDLYLLEGNLKHPNLATLYNSIGGGFFRRKDFDMARMNFELSLRRYDEIYDSNTYYHTYPLINLSEYFIEINQFDKAEACLVQAIEISNNVQIPVSLTSSIYLSYGNLLFEMDDFKKALSYYNQSLGILQSGMHKPTIYSAEVYVKIGISLVNLNRHLEARTYLIKALKVLDENGVENGSHVVDANVALGRSFLAIEDFPAALKYLNRAINLSLDDDCTILGHEIPNIDHYSSPYLLFDAIAAKGDYYLAAYEVDDDIDNLRLALELFRVNENLAKVIRTNYRTDESKFELADKAHLCFQKAIPTAYKLYEKTGDEQFFFDAFRFSESDKAGILKEALLDVDAKQFAGIPDSLVEKERKVKINLSYFREQLFYEKQKTKKQQDASKIKKLQDNVVLFSREYDNIVSFMEKRYPDYHDLKLGESHISVQKIQNSLGGNQVMLQYFLGKEWLYIFVIDKLNFSVKQVAYCGDIFEEIADFRASIEAKNYVDYMDFSFGLYQLLIDPVLEEIANKKLVIIPGGVLNSIPFGLLTQKACYSQVENFYTAPYLINDYPICYNYSAALYAKSKVGRNKKPKHSFLGFAPDFNNNSLAGSRGLVSREGRPENLRPLPWAAKEVEVVGEGLEGDYLIGEEATEEKFKELSSNYSVLHFATHGILKDENPLYSGLVFQKDERSGEDGYLHTHELYNLKLNADMAVLSACNTGLGKVKKGEGAMSLARGFAYAGCPNLVVSKWSLADRSTATLVQYFYDFIEKGLPKDEAMQQAKIVYLKNSHHASISPVFWGGLTIIGNELPIQLKKRSWFSMFF